MATLGSAASVSPKCCKSSRPMPAAVLAGSPVLATCSQPGSTRRIDTLNVSFLQELLNTIAEQGRQLLPRSLAWLDRTEDIGALAQALVSGRGEASGVAIASALLARYRELDADDRRAFLMFPARTMEPDADSVENAANDYLNAPSPASVAALQRAVESPRLEF